MPVRSFLTSSSSWLSLLHSCCCHVIVVIVLRPVFFYAIVLLSFIRSFIGHSFAPDRIWRPFYRYQGRACSEMHSCDSRSSPPTWMLLLHLSTSTVFLCFSVGCLAVGSFFTYSSILYYNLVWPCVSFIMITIAVLFQSIQLCLICSGWILLDFFH